MLHNLRRALPDPDRFPEVAPRTLRWRPDAPYRLDVAEFEELPGRAGADPEGRLALLRAAVDAYSGDLLPGSYDDRVLDERERLARHDPLAEETCRLLMRLHDARGDRSRALRAYHECASGL